MINLQLEANRDRINFSISLRESDACKLQVKFEKADDVSHRRPTADIYANLYFQGCNLKKKNKKEKKENKT